MGVESFPNQLEPLKMIEVDLAEVIINANNLGSNS